MATIAAITAGVGAVAGAYGSRQQRKAAERQAKAASQPTSYERTTTSDPWGPSTGYRKYGMKHAKGLLTGGIPGGSGTYSAKGYSPQQLTESMDLYRKWASGEGNQNVSDYIGTLMPGEGKQYQGNPFTDQMIDAALRGTEDRYKQGLAGLALGAESAGRYGGGSHQLASAEAAERFGNTLADTEGRIRYEDYNARMADLMGLLGMQQQGQMFGVSGVGQGEQFNVGAVNQARARNAAAQNAARANNSMAGWRNLGAYSDVINAMSRGYGTTTEKGYNQGPQVAPAATPDPWMSAIQGGLSGYQLGSNIGGAFGGPASYTAAPTSGQAARNAQWGWG